ncbi:zinc dependent phospholipase C family protein [Paenibacillus sp. GP183]|jgi:hypothetical protein|uniref:zinc dependent phospholipase C family protein n=1 Tax=Paenibacillus sp. GP183 TaxID=1882751 RepID=UPI000898F602|nr:zinc dependent phospholipase C family protein [Paenibacillus sp. GP183]SEB55329.1 Zinc dependent phospholipase C [Paenibacillus sp. GP183]
MPNIWTHLLFGQELMSKLGHEDVWKDKQLRNVFNLGCQGPDFLFYHHFLPWQRDKKMAELGSLMHKKECGPFLLDLVHHVHGRGLYNPAVLYVLGFITHHILDRNMHPYVFHKSGFKKWKHQRFEIIMDTLVVKKMLGKETWNTPVWKEIDVGKAFPMGIVPALMDAAAKRYPALSSKIASEDWDEAYRDMIKAQRLFHDPTGMKRALTLGQISPLVYEKQPAPLDYLNEARATWNCPTSLDETYSHSVWDLWEQAGKDGEQVMKAALQTLQSGLSAKGDHAAELEMVLGNVSYETGKSCDSGLEIVHVNPMI